MSRKKFKLLMLLALAGALGLAAVSMAIHRSINREMALPVTEAVSVAPAVLEEEPVNKEVKTLRPTDARALAVYPIIAQHGSVAMRNEQYWREQTTHMLAQTDVINRVNEGKVFRGIDRTPEQYLSQVRRIDQRIEIFKQRAMRNPGDSGAQQKLQELYMLKSSLGALKDTVVFRNTKK